MEEHLKTEPEFDLGEEANGPTEAPAINHNEQNTDQMETPQQIDENIAENKQTPEFNSFKVQQLKVHQTQPIDEQINIEDQQEEQALQFEEPKSEPYIQIDSVESPAVVPDDAP